jgi:arylsulfatase A-like enzyme
MELLPSTKAALPQPRVQRSPAPIRVSPLGVIGLAIACGLAGGYCDAGIIVLKKYLWNEPRFFGTASDFPWTVPIGHVLLLAVPGVLLALLTAARPKPVSLRAAAWLFATLAVWTALLRLPFYGISTLVLAFGLGRPISGGIASLCRRPRQAQLALSGLVVMLLVVAASSMGWQSVRNRRTSARWPAPPSNARNVILIVWDTVRANHLSLYGYHRDTTPRLKQWARKGVQFKLALAPAPWTFPSHTSFFTGRWPFQLNAQWRFTLDSAYPTLAEYLTSRGYDTAGIVGNTSYCSYESGLDRGFAHFEDYPLTPRSVWTRSVPGKWVIENILSFTDLYAKKWIAIESRGARAIDEAFLDWLHDRRPERPFFAFLNYFDAHQPYIAPAEYDGRFGIRPGNSRDYEFLAAFGGANQRELRLRDIQMAGDCYDNCIAFLDDELGRLLEKLDAQKLLDNTDVIITSDHGEEFAEHGVVGHNNSVMLNEVGVPLVVLSPRAVAGRVVDHPVSLRDLPATVVDLLGLADGSPFPGCSLAAHWGTNPGQLVTITSPAFTEQAGATAFQTQPRPGHEQPVFQMSLVAQGHHYIRYGTGLEKLYELKTDPFERFDLMKAPDGNRQVGEFRRLLLEMLASNTGTAEVEDAYLKSCRKRLESLVYGQEPTIAISAAN